MKLKPLFIAIFFILFLSLLAGGSIGSTDLTPDTPPAAPAPAGAELGLLAAGNAGGSGGGPCGGVYTVQSGDTLFGIARKCGMEMDALLAANPSITNPNLIHAGQQLVIYYSPPAVQAPTAVPATAMPASVEMAAPTELAAVEPVNTDTPAAAEQVPAEPVPAAPTTAGTQAPAPSTVGTIQAVLLPEGLQPGGSVHVTITGLPASTLVTIGIGRVVDQPIQIDEVETDAEGRLDVRVAIPTRAKTGEFWMVTITGVEPKVKVTSDPFVIE